MGKVLGIVTRTLETLLGLLLGGHRHRSSCFSVLERFLLLLAARVALAHLTVMDDGNAGFAGAKTCHALATFVHPCTAEAVGQAVT